jgi:diguanylate cyclase (GGDEF)-like protein/PAS domain S-box-containing protein
VVAETSEPSPDLEADQAAAIVARAPIGVAELDANLNLRWANDLFASIAGYGADGDQPRFAFDFVHPSDQGQLFVPPTEGVVVARCRTRVIDGEVQGVRITLKRSDQLNTTIVIAFVEPLDTPQAPMLSDLYEATRSYSALFQNLTDIVAVCDAHGRIKMVLPGTPTVLGWDPRSLNERLLWDFCHPDETEQVRAAFDLMTQMPGVPITREFRMLHAAGSWSWLNVKGVSLLADPQIGSVILIANDVTERRQAEALQRNQSEIFELIACRAKIELILARIAQLVEENTQGSRAGIFVLDDDRLKLGIAPRVPGELVESIVGTGRRRWFGAIRSALLEQRMTIVEDTNESDLYIDHRELLDDVGIRSSIAVPIADDDESLAGALTVYFDSPRYTSEAERTVAENAARLAAIALQRHRADERLSHLAHHDKLTGLPNRALLQEKLEESIRYARQHRSSVAVMFLDLDNFKIVNDSFGHATGDQLLIGFAERLSKLVRPNDFLGRFGGDEFVVLLEHVQSAEDAIPVAERLLDDLRQPFHIKGRNVFLTVSVGIAVSPRGRASSENLLRNADSAMYKAKGRGRSRIEIFADNLTETASARLLLEGDLRQAIERDQFILHWQPKISLDAGRIVSAEALVRWDHPTRGMLEPAEFIHVAEEIEIIDEIGRWVLEEAIRQRAAWDAEHGDEAPWSIAVNVSALQLSAPRAAETVAMVLERFDWPAERLVLELTESVLMDEVSEAAPVLLRLKESGIQIAIDDFGTGYSSLSYLHRFPVDQVKLDKSFVESINSDGEGSPIARAVINMAHALGISVTAEGVETIEQARGLRVLGCERAQGFLFGRPVAASEFSAVLRKKPRFVTLEEDVTAA